MHFPMLIHLAVQSVCPEIWSISLVSNNFCSMREIGL